MVLHLIPGVDNENAGFDAGLYWQAPLTSEGHVRHLLGDKSQIYMDESLYRFSLSWCHRSGPWPLDVVRAFRWLSL